MKKMMIAGSLAAAMASSPLWAVSGSGAYWSGTGADRILDSEGRCVRTGSWYAGTQIPGCDAIKKPEPVVQPVVTFADSDNDGVPDNVDSCPNTPAGVVVNRLGCIPDSDGDGVADNRDQCAGTPAGTLVDDQGCIKVVKTPVTYRLNVQFDHNSSVVSSRYGKEFEDVARLLKEDPGVVIEIAGHTDATGSAEYNRWLSQRRAEKVVDILVRQYGVDPARLRPVGYGADRPVADNGSAAGRAANRRVEAEVKVLVTKR